LSSLRRALVLREKEEGGNISFEFGTPVLNKRAGGNLDTRTAPTRDLLEEKGNKPVVLYSFLGKREGIRRRGEGTINGAATGPS